MWCKQLEICCDKPDEEGKQKDVPIDLLKVAEGVLDRFEEKGTKNIITRNEQFITPNGQEGIKTFGTAEFLVEDKLVKGAYIHIRVFDTQYITTSYFDLERRGCICRPNCRAYFKFYRTY